MHPDELYVSVDVETSGPIQANTVCFPLELVL